LNAAALHLAPTCIMSDASSGAYHFSFSKRSMKFLTLLSLCVISMAIQVHAVSQAKLPSIESLRAGKTEYKFKRVASLAVWVKKGSNSVFFIEDKGTVRKPTKQELNLIANSKSKADSRRLGVDTSGTLLPPDVEPLVLPAGRSGRGAPETDGRRIKASLNEGVEWAFQKCGADLNMRGITNVLHAKALVQAVASLETSFGKNMPNETDQKGYEVSKWGTDMQEIGITKMNKKMLGQIGYGGDDHIKLMNDLSNDEGLKLNAEAFVCSIAKLGLDAMSHYHRGGESRWEDYKKPDFSEDRKMDTAALMLSYHWLQKKMLDDDLVDPTTADVYWMHGPPAISGNDRTLKFDWSKYDIPYEKLKSWAAANL
jgi:hypothetical protein